MEPESKKPIDEVLTLLKQVIDELLILKDEVSYIKSIIKKEEESEIETIGWRLF